jgi:hypothetical protein
MAVTTIPRTTRRRYWWRPICRWVDYGRQNTCGRWESRQGVARCFRGSPELAGKQPQRVAGIWHLIRSGEDACEGAPESSGQLFAINDDKSHVIFLHCEPGRRGAPPHLREPYCVHRAAFDVGLYRELTGGWVGGPRQAAKGYTHPYYPYRWKGK